MLYINFAAKFWNTPDEKSEFGRQIFFEHMFENPNSKLSAKSSYTLILKFQGKLLKNVKALLAFRASAFYAKTRIEIWRLLPSFRGFLDIN